jgi:hypothetical protein
MNTTPSPSIADQVNGLLAKRATAAPADDTPVLVLPQPAVTPPPSAVTPPPSAVTPPPSAVTPQQTRPLTDE